MDSPAYDYSVHPDIYIAERERLEKLYKDGKLEIVARREVTEVKLYSDYLVESVATNARLCLKYGASSKTMPPYYK